MKRLFIVLSTLAAVVGCTVSELGNDAALRESSVYTAGFENPDTRVYVDSGLKTHWTADDRISIFTQTYNEQFKFDGATGDTEGSFTSLDSKFHTGAELPAVYAVYPYSDDTSITSEGTISLNLPAVQHYAKDSFGLGANTMVAVTESKKSTALTFKNLCGYIVIKLYGDATIKSITLSGNNGEKLAGPATVAPVYGQAPAVQMSDAATQGITLDCGNGVQLGKTADDATAFWFAVPPVTFSKGFTVRVTNTEFWSMEKSVSTEKTVVRNIANSMAPLKVSTFDIPGEGLGEDDEASGIRLASVIGGHDGDVAFFYDYDDAGNLFSIAADDKTLYAKDNFTLLLSSFDDDYYDGKYFYQEWVPVTNDKLITKMTCRWWDTYEADGEFTVDEHADEITFDFQYNAKGQLSSWSGDVTNYYRGEIETKWRRQASISYDSLNRIAKIVSVDATIYDIEYPTDWNWTNTYEFYYEISQENKFCQFTLDFCGCIFDNWGSEDCTGNDFTPIAPFAFAGFFGKSSSAIPYAMSWKQEYNDNGEIKTYRGIYELEPCILNADGTIREADEVKYFYKTHSRAAATAADIMPAPEKRGNISSHGFSRKPMKFFRRSREQ